ncbi:DUF2809 domain-containing protein [Flavobacterium sp. 5]|uniref:ribosomal maturation YjgA family protein n=1 Tax=Flavobacterium sp. 5 TaxID=2035199 RepID=UPI000C2CA6B0|nr:DUF2809 domain-containing protein [Flavobacterium sp. 5]PKB17222.1 uncharacterized protein DUF2809 [Flavobacterium sp. 5]
MLTFNKKYFLLTILIFVTEVLIALFVHDDIIRPYIGDVLVVILIYCFIKSFLELPVLPVAIFVLLFSFGIEFLQYLHIVEKLGLQKSKVAATVIGTSFAWIDLVCYVVGIIFVFIVEKGFKNNVALNKN